jgi:hypothetical protein
MEEDVQAAVILMILGLHLSLLKSVTVLVGNRFVWESLQADLGRVAPLCRKLW